jgi:alanine-glyoxylate transaminase / serine-glyoxylate transaminase / serine-pyruvate transaminase
MADDEPILMIPGPTEFRQSVLNAMSTKGTSHVSPAFIEQYGASLDALVDVFQAERESSASFALAGSGSLGWDLTVSNLMESGDRALIVNSGYFGDSFGDAVQSYGHECVHALPEKGKIGDVPLAERVASVLGERGPFKLVAMTHVDTSTGVRVNVQAIAAAVRRVDERVIVAVDGVCSIGAERFLMAEWDVDVAFTGSQKALGVPPGLCCMVARKRALDAHAARSTPSLGYYCSWARWLPIMANYRARKPSYFATPAVQLIMALHTSLTTAVLGDGGMEARYAEHERVASAFRAALAALNIDLVAASANVAANTLTAARYPANVDGVALRASMSKHGVIVAGGLHRDIKAQYFRVGHMGLSATMPEHVERVVGALESALLEQSYELARNNVALKAFQESYQKTK